MTETFDHRKIESKWRKEWEKKGLYKAVDFSKRPKRYILIEFPYPSGERLHVGHGRSYSCFDAVARLLRMQGFNVLFPIGWDAFGLPAENYAIRTGIHPAVTTKENIKTSKKQAKAWGLSFDWDREITTTDPEYYKWTQWVFLQFFKKGLAYKKEIPVNWCPSCKINLANEEVVQGACERCGTPVTRRMQSQWLLKITEYADRLLKDLDKVDYREDIKAQQVNWIGRSEGARIKFPVVKPLSRQFIEVFTTRPDTLFGATFLVLSPEKAQEYLELLPKREHKEVHGYIEEALAKSELQRQEETKEKTGVFTGLYAKHPTTGEDIPIWVSDFVLMGYGTGAIMGVPAHDSRDFEFAKKFKIPIKEVVKNDKESNFPKEPFEGEGRLINSVRFNGLQSKEAIAKINAWLKKEKLGEPAIDYKLRDWVFSRQHYWGEPIPIVYCSKCWERAEVRDQRSGLKEGYDYAVIDGKEHKINPVPDKDLPVELPHVKRYKPTQTGESPLAAVHEWVEVKCPSCGSQARRETDTMPNWAGSSWYFVRYVDPQNKGRFAGKKKLSYWMPVDWYNGGMEHTTLHLLYSRFWYKFLYDLKLVPDPEPYAKRTSHGVVLGPDGYRMSKSRGNVVNPDEVVSEFGADTFRMYEAFMGPFDQVIVWDLRGVLGVRRFLDKVYRAHQAVGSQESVASSKELERKLHQLIKKVEEDTLSLKFNTAVAAMMGFINEVASSKYQVAREGWKTFLKVLAPYAPHLSEELWHGVGENDSVHLQKWPKFDPKLIKEEVVTIVIQINGKIRGKMEVEAGAKKEKVSEKARNLDSVKPHLHGRKVAKTIYVADNLINFVTA
ncbi:leucine--tRNA ligase [Candidatus Saccharibacteria bacterium]|nr:leucine--tRNA ligase [Candidatus Saccharibacteria bacterium]